MKWIKNAEYQEGSVELIIEEASILHCIVSYNNVAQHYGWIQDKTTVLNARRKTYEVFDSGLEQLREIFATAQRRNAHDFESAVSWLVWLLGFNVINLGNTQKTRDAVDLIATTPQGHFIVIECTTGLLGADKKLALLHERAQMVRDSLDQSNNHHIKVLPVIVTSKSRSQVKAEIEQAERLGTLIITKEKLERAILATLIQPDPDQLYTDAEEEVKGAQAKYESQGILPLPAN